MISLTDLFKETRKQQSTIAISIISHLGYFDVQRLACTSRTFAKLLSINQQDKNSNNEDLQHIIYWLRDLKVLHSLQCPKYLLHKISHAIYNKSYRIMSFEEGAYDTPQIEEEKTIFHVFETSFPCRFFGSTPDFQFNNVHPLDLEERELEVGEMFDDVCYDKETSEYQPSTYGGDGLECDFMHCKQDFVSRIFYVNGKAVCGKCIDEVCFLKLRFCAEFYRADNSSFNVEELDYDDKEDLPSRWGMGNDEFWAQIWYTAPYNYGELRFVGVGPRQSSGEKKEKVEDSHDDVVEKRRIALESIRESIRKRQKL